MILDIVGLLTLFYGTQYTLRAIYYLFKAMIFLILGVLGFPYILKDKIKTHKEKILYKEQPVKSKIKIPTDFEMNTKINISNLTKKLNKVRCKTGAKQLKQLENKYSNFKEILTETLSKDELSYIRYTDKINKSSSFVINNLQQSCLLLKSIATVEYKDNNLIQKDSPNKKSVHEIRFNLWESQNLKVKGLLMTNESILTNIDRLISKLSTINLEKTDWNSTIEELNNLKNNIS